MLTFWKADGGLGRLPLCCVTKSLKSKLKFHFKKKKNYNKNIFCKDNDLSYSAGNEPSKFLKIQNNKTPRPLFFFFFIKFTFEKVRAPTISKESAYIFVDRYVLQVKALMPNHRPEKERATAPVTQLNP